jgi:uncharacterized caspase-like protein
MDGQWLLTGSEDWNARLWDVQTGMEVRRFRHGAPVSAVALSVDAGWVLTGSWDGIGRLWETATGTQVRQFRGHDEMVTSVALSPDGRWALTGSRDGTARLWETASGLEVHQLRGYGGFISSVAFSPDGRWVLTGTWGGTAELWRTDEGVLVATLISFRDGHWAVVDTAGRFDSDDLEEISGLHWLMPDDPMRALPVETFMRDYYEPRLLARILKEERFAPVRSLADLNRVQPTVTIKEIVPEKSDEFVTVLVQVEKATREFHRGESTQRLETKPFDLRLFRDGQLVGIFPAPTEPADLPSLSGTDQDDLTRWRDAKAITVDSTTGKRSIRFEHVRVPRRQDLTSVMFSAYAFNEDRVKSHTARQQCVVADSNAPPFPSSADHPCVLPKPTPRPGRAYLVTVGVNASDDPAWDLTFAVNDAQRLQAAVQSRLEQTGRFAQVVAIPLLTDVDSKAGSRRRTVNDATKAHIKGVLDLLAGRQLDPAVHGHIPHAQDLQPARPEDLVVLAVSSHGYVDERGQFYLFPSDIGVGHGPTVTPQLLQQTISSEQLAQWLQAVDAGELVLIVDACHAAATVQTADFKPGPMGSRGLGQLSYDKGMRILAASQAVDVALESRVLKQGLLSYALVQEGLEAQQADFRPKDQTIVLKEWLQYGVERVPKLYAEVQHGMFQAKGVTSHFGTSAQTLAHARPGLQQPSLFDFRKLSGEVVISQWASASGP